MSMEDIMRSLGRRDARELRAEAKELDGTAIIDREVSVPDFDQQKNYTSWPAGAPVVDGGQVWTLLQPYNAAHHPGRPAELRAQWGLCHTTNPDKAKAWVPPQGTSGIYKKNECYKDESGLVWRCVVEQTDHDANAWPSGWKLVNQNGR